METPTAIYFYSHHKQHDYMSNFYPVTFVENGTRFNCSEQYLMYWKCRLFDGSNKEMLDCILAETDPAQIKKYGRMVANFDPEVWDLHKLDIMVEGLRLKFNQNTELQMKLQATSPKILFEASANDRIWGIGFSASKAITMDESHFGQNLLGTALMKVRDES